MMQLTGSSGLVCMNITICRDDVIESQETFQTNLTIDTSLSQGQMAQIVYLTTIARTIVAIDDSSGKLIIAFGYSSLLTLYIHVEP